MVSLVDISSVYQTVLRGVRGAPSAPVMKMIIELPLSSSGKNETINEKYFLR